MTLIVHYRLSLVARPSFWFTFEKTKKAFVSFQFHLWLHECALSIFMRSTKRTSQVWNGSDWLNEVLNYHFANYCKISTLLPLLLLLLQLRILAIYSTNETNHLDGLKTVGRTICRLKRRNLQWIGMLLFRVVVVQLQAFNWLLDPPSGKWEAASPFQESFI